MTTRLSASGGYYEYERGEMRFVDADGTRWRLEPTGDRGMPIIISIETRDFSGIPVGLDESQPEGTISIESESPVVVTLPPPHAGATLTVQNRGRAPVTIFGVSPVRTLERFERFERKP